MTMKDVLDMYNFVVKKIEEVQMKIRDLKRIEQMLLNLKESCPNDKILYWNARL